MKSTPGYLVVERNISWVPLKSKGGSGAAWIKIFAKDAQTGATAALVKYEKGYRAGKTVSKVYSDSIILGGRLTDGTRTLVKNSYLYRPPESEYGPILAEEETVKFVITGGKGELCSTKPIFIEDVETKATGKMDLGGPWSMNVLRRDKVGDVTVTYQVAHRSGIVKDELTWVHAHTEEAYYIELDGPTQDYLADIDGWVVYDSPCYIYRPPNSYRHGSPHYNPCKLFVKYYSASLPYVFERHDVTKGIPAPELVE